MNDSPSTKVSRQPRISRRTFVASAATATLGAALDGVAAQTVSAESKLTGELPPAVQMQFMRPAQLEKAIKQFPVVYVPPIGVLVMECVEWICIRVLAGMGG